MQIAAVLAKPIQIANSMNTTTGVQILLNCLDDIHNLVKQRYYAEQLFKLLKLVSKVKPVRVSILKNDPGAIQKLTFHLFASLDLDKKGSGGTHFDYVLQTLEALVSEVAIMESMSTEQQDSEERMDTEEADSELA